ncbi:MAG: hypothetical protein VX438_08700, partial [Planctomycetota bacterium]|nr:hypothetical protein [Planctomycetota bacterium]
MIYSPLIKPDHSKRLNPQKIGQLLVFLFLTGLLSPGQNCGRTEEPTDPDSIRHVDGFKIELLRSATNGEDSWISMCFDDRGRILLGLDTMGVGRLTLGKGTPPSFEKIENSLKHCRGVLFAYN